jgi:threonine synthase
VKYVSTRGQAPILDFDQVLLAGLARDGGLYVPESWPHFSTLDIRSLRGLSYPQVAAKIIEPFVAGCLTPDEIGALCQDTYGAFSHPAVAPLTQMAPDRWLLELFHGPTLAFKDYALQLVGRLFDHVLKKRGEHVTIVGATSGDTGSAALESCRDRDCIKIVILHPKGRVSEVQRRQMTTILSANVRNLAVDGTFDDCQNIVKTLFNDHQFRDEFNLSAVNSINWARIMAQIAYYFWAAVALGAPDRPVAFSVPTGNFGNVFAGYAAMRMGLPISQLVVGSNRNDILTRFFETGSMTASGVVPTLSPSMDIQVSSNFERLMWEFLGRDGAATAQLLTEFNRSGIMSLPAPAWTAMTSLFQAYRFDDQATQAIMRQTYEQTGQILDPHSAIGYGAALASRPMPGIPLISLATAHPAKFPDAVKAATGIHPALPSHLSDLLTRPERMDGIAADCSHIKDYVRNFVKGPNV